MENVLFIISGPSGVGKGTLVKLLLAEDGNLTLSVSCTTRAPRQGERDGREYFFLTEREFLERAEKGGFLEYDRHFGNYYGTPRDYVLEKLETQSVILEIDVVGALNVAKVFRPTGKKVVLIMIAPPDLETLKRRLAGRETESEEELEKRLMRVQYELSMQPEYDYVVKNGDLHEAKTRLQEIINRERNK